MSIETASLLVTMLGVYVVLGILFAIPFVLRGAGRIDPVAQDGTWGFRVMIFPGVVALWPLLAWRWARGAESPTEKNPHRTAAASRATAEAGR